MPHGLARLQIHHQAIRLVQFGFSPVRQRVKWVILGLAEKGLRIDLLEPTRETQFVQRVIYG